MPGLAQEHVGEEAAAHPDLAVDTPDRERDPLRLERLVPGQHVLIHAVDERAVEIEEKAGLWPRAMHDLVLLILDALFSVGNTR